MAVGVVGAVEAAVAVVVVGAHAMHLTQSSLLSVWAEGWRLVPGWLGHGPG